MGYKNRRINYLYVKLLYNCNVHLVKMEMNFRFAVLSVFYCHHCIFLFTTIVLMTFAK